MITNNASKRAWVSIAALALFGSNVIVAYTLSAQYNAEIAGLLRHEQVSTETQILLRLLHDAGGVIATYSATRNVEAYAFFDPLVTQIHEHLRNLGEITSGQASELSSMKLIETQINKSLEVMRRVKSDVDNPNVTLKEMIKHNHMSSLSTASHAVESELNLLVIIDAGKVPSVASLNTKQWIMAIEIMGLCFLNVVSGVVFLSLCGVRSGERFASEA